MTQSIEVIDGHTYLVYRDDAGEIIGQLAQDPAPTVASELTKWQYRALFTLDERVAIDNYADNPGLTAEQKATMRTLQFDFSIAESINLTDAATMDGTQALEDFGLIGPGRAAQVLAGVPPA